MSASPRIGILALQGAFIEHAHMLNKLGACPVEIRQPSDLIGKIDGLILPGGESTTQGKLLRALDLFTPLKNAIENGLPTLATCAGMILLAHHLEEQETTHLHTMPITVKRNAYGRQLGSFFTQAPFGDLGTVPMTFIRAPYISEASPQVTILSEVKGHIVAARYKKQLALSFHPELDPSPLIHEYFLQMI